MAYTDEAIYRGRVIRVEARQTETGSWRGHWSTDGQTSGQTGGTYRLPGLAPAHAKAEASFELDGV